MSVGHSRRRGKTRRGRAVLLRRPSAWSLWTVVSGFRRYLLAVDALAVALVVVSVALVPITTDSLVTFAILTAASVAHLEVTSGVERLRELHTEGRVFVPLMPVWTLAGMLVLPFPLVAALVALGYTHMWFRLGRKIVPHRWVFSASNVVVASGCGALVLHLAFPTAYPTLPVGSAGFAVIVAATLVRWIVNRTLAISAVRLMQPGRTKIRQLASLGPNDLIECGALSLGVIAAVLLANPVYLVAFGVVVLVMHHALSALQFESSARKDSVTGLHSAGFWHELGGQTLARAAAQHTTVALLLVHLDRFDALTDRLGVGAGDQLLRRVADAVRGNSRKQDLLGRLPSHDIALLLPGATTNDIATIADRIRQSIHDISADVTTPDGSSVVVAGLTASIGGAIYPDHAADLKELLLTADGNVIAAQYARGDQVRFPRPAQPR